MTGQQEAIVEEFGMLEGNLELTLDYLMDLGERMPAFPESERTDANLVRGCQSKVWLYIRPEQDKVRLAGDSNTAITKGLVSLLVRVYDNHTPDEILQTRITFPERIGMDRFIGTQRSNGFAAMIQHIQNTARAIGLITNNA